MPILYVNTAFNFESLIITACNSVRGISGELYWLHLELHNISFQHRYHNVSISIVTSQAVQCQIRQMCYIYNLFCDVNKRKTFPINNLQEKSVWYNIISMQMQCPNYPRIELSHLFLHILISRYILQEEKNIAMSFVSKIVQP